MLNARCCGNSGRVAGVLDRERSTTPNTKGASRCRSRSAAAPPHCSRRSPSVALGATYAYASIPDRAGVIHGCYDQKNGSCASSTGGVPSWVPARTTRPARLESDRPAGAAGPQGVQGPQGLQGPKGDPATIDNLSTTVVSKDFPIGTFDNEEGVVTCPTGSVGRAAASGSATATCRSASRAATAGGSTPRPGFFDPDHFTVFALCLEFRQSREPRAAPPCLGGT